MLSGSALSGDNVFRCKDNDSATKQLLNWFLTCSAAMAAACACAWNSGDVASMAAMGEWYMEETEDS